MPFIHLKIHTEYSITDGVVRIPALIERAKQLRMPAVAITDLMNLFGLIKFYKQAVKAGIKPIVGCDLWVLDENNQRTFKITALCQDLTGYRNLTKLITAAYMNNIERQRVVILQQELWDAHEGLIILSGGQTGLLDIPLLTHQVTSAKQTLQTWQQKFADRFYLEIMRIGQPEEHRYNQALVTVASELQIPVVATNAVCFLARDDYEAHEARVCINEGVTLNDKRRQRRYTEEQYLKSSDEMHALFADVPSALTNAFEIAKRCNLELTLGEARLPNYPLPAGEVSIEDYLRKTSQHCLQVYLSEAKTNIAAATYQARLQKELDVICNMGFSGYFLIVADFIAWSKDNGIPVGPGRGSGAGSLVAFILGITSLDPLQHELLFERFLNPERISMPDFDVDFCMEGRDRVIEYVAERYGRECVSQIITYGTMAAKAVVRDVGRVLGLPYGFVDKLAKLIPFELGMTLEKALGQEEQLRERYQQEPEVRALIDLALKLEGLTRNAGKHAGGVVIAPTRLIDFTPLYCELGSQQPVSQFDKDDVEAVGLVKFDFLGLRTLTIIDWALRAINKKRQQQNETPIDLQKLVLDDVAAYELLKSAETVAVFQLESRGMRDLIRRLKPDSFEDITALVALFRPGPLQSGMVDDFINRKHGRASVDYAHPDLKPILQSTYGVILYQEQVMQIAQVLAGYSLGGADILRRAMGKKKPEEMARQREVFLEGSQKNNIDAKTANYIFDLMEKFAGYGFNKSHSAAYALIAYQTAWLKAHYPSYFMAAVLSSDMDNTDKIIHFIDECTRMQLSILAPNVNRGEYQFVVNDAGQIEYGLGAIKGVGEAIIMDLVAERHAHGPYVSLFDLCMRLGQRKLNRRILEALIYAGACDCFEVSRASMHASIDKALQAAHQHVQHQSSGQNDLFGGFDQSSEHGSLDYIPAQWTKEALYKAEKVSLGYYRSGHPLEAFQDELQHIATTTIDHLTKYKSRTVKLVALIHDIRTIQTKNGNRMAVLSLEDVTGRTEATVFSRLFAEVRNLLVADEVVCVEGSVEDDDFTGGVRLRVESVMPINEVRKRHAKGIRLNVEKEVVEQLLHELPHVIEPYRGGSCPITISYTNQKAYAELLLGKEWQVDPEDALLDQLNQLCGHSNAKVVYQ